MIHTHRDQQPLNGVLGGVEGPPLIHHNHFMTVAAASTIAQVLVGLIIAATIELRLVLEWTVKVVKPRPSNTWIPFAYILLMLNLGMGLSVCLKSIVLNEDVSKLWAGFVVGSTSLSISIMTLLPLGTLTARYYRKSLDTLADKVRGLPKPWRVTAAIALGIYVSAILFAYQWPLAVTSIMLIYR